MILGKDRKVVVDTYPCSQVFDILVTSLKSFDLKNANGYAIKIDHFETEFLDPRDLVLDIRVKDTKRPHFFIKKQLIFPIENLRDDEINILIEQVRLSYQGIEANEI